MKLNFLPRVVFRESKYHCRTSFIPCKYQGGKCAEQKEHSQHTLGAAAGIGGHGQHVASVSETVSAGHNIHNNIHVSHTASYATTAHLQTVHAQNPPISHWRAMYKCMYIYSCTIPVQICLHYQSVLMYCTYTFACTHGCHVNVFKCLCMHVYIHACVFMHACMYTYMHVCLCMHACVHTCMCVHT